MKTSQRGLAEIASHEAIVTSKYKDSVGVWTIGIGHTIGAGLPDPRSITAALPISKLMEIFARDIARFEARVNKAFTRQLSQSQFDAAVSFDFNTGGIHRASWVKHFNKGDMKSARRAFMAWRKPKEIIARRKKECDLFFKGIYGANGYVSVYRATAGGKVLWSSGKRVKLPINTLRRANDDAPRSAIDDPALIPPRNKAKPKSPLNPIAMLISVLAAAGVAFWDKIQTIFQGW